MNIKNVKMNWMKLVRMFCFIILATGIFVSISGVQDVKAVQVGQVLTVPEIGWNRIEEVDPNISYSGNWINRNNEAYSGGNRKETLSGSYSISFDFTGTKLRIINSAASSYNCMSMSIDGGTNIILPITTYNGNLIVIYENLALSNSEHNVKIFGNSVATWDAIDIDSNAVIKPYSETLPIMDTGITLNKSTNNLQVGQSDTLIPTITPSNANTQTVTWTSSDPNIATVDNTGKVTGVKAGTATITATTADGKTATCVVTVTDSNTTTPTNPTTPTGSRATLIIDMNNGMIKQYDLSASELTSFLTWYDSRSKGTAVSYYTFNLPITGPYLTKKDSIAFDKIDDYEVQEYNK